MFENKTISLILPAYNEGLNISNFINEVKKLNLVGPPGLEPGTNTL